MTRERSRVGFYVRKSVKAGPFRFNLSKSGVGVSVGAPGFRVGTGPRGNYVHMGRGGVYYRASLGAPARGATGGVRAGVTPAPTWTPYDPGAVILDDVTGATIMDMQPTGGGGIVEQLNAAARHTRLAWWVTAIAVVAGAATLPFGLIIWVLAIPLCWWLFLRDAASTKAVVFYDVNDDAAQWFDDLVTNWGWLTNATKLWRTVASGQVHTLHQHKRNAGASNIITRVDATATAQGPKHLATNVAVPTIVAGKTSLHFLPDRVLIREGKSYTDVAYSHLRVHARKQRFIESPGATPKDAVQVDHTWQYVNKKGGPDRRFSSNPVLPIMLYSNLELTSAHGLNWRIQASQQDAAVVVGGVLERLAR
ncbi:DUF4236 domain-containing protein [Microbacterium phyllosphaerae]|uniref:DUF4236 domain-containing protein n=1 Tax=Microbacterium phyllosphaerae TaxID=124798 RepID=UPI002168E2C5|nr:DUF4236 domain-containing protein [Microbacterium phyllosphaerae]MCS3442159.1 hypothetical protein [Microbacterium phyllosphaerae]